MRKRDRPAPTEEVQESGFSALELLMTLAVLGLVIAVTLPGAIRSFATYQRDGAARQLLADIRATQSAAVMQGGVFGLQWGSDTGVSLPADQYRIVRDTSGSCGLPAVGAPADGTNVIRAWRELSENYSGVTIQSIRDSSNKPLGGVMFNAMGSAVNTCTSVSFPVTVVVSDQNGMTREIQVRSAGSTRLL